MGLVVYLPVAAVAPKDDFSLIGFILALFVSGLIVGALGRLIVPGRQPIGILATAGLGILGSIIGGLIGRLIFGPHYVPGLIISVLGAALLIWLVAGRRSAPR
jgi:uncharacterized membrane protein YeaQ/YmgE (transglycosylase-associated protein family)